MEASITYHLVSLHTSWPMMGELRDISRSMCLPPPYAWWMVFLMPLLPSKSPSKVALADLVLDQLNEAYSFKKSSNRWSKSKALLISVIVTGSCDLLGRARRPSRLERLQHKSASQSMCDWRSSYYHGASDPPGKGWWSWHGGVSLSSHFCDFGCRPGHGGISDAGYYCPGSCQEASHCFLPCVMPCVSFPIKEESEEKNPNFPKLGKTMGGYISKIFWKYSRDYHCL